MSEIYDRPTTQPSLLDWATTATGTVTEWDEDKRTGGFYYGETVPAGNVNFRWNLMGEWTRYSFAAAQRRFDSLYSGANTCSVAEVFWADSGYREPLQEVFSKVADQTQPGVITDLSCDGERGYYSIGRNVASFNPETGTEDSDYLYTVPATVHSVFSDGKSVYATVSGTSFYKLDRDDSEVSYVTISTGSYASSKFKSNGFEGVSDGGFEGTNDHIVIMENLNSTPSIVGAVDVHHKINDVACGDTKALACGSVYSGANVTSTLLTGVADWTAMAGESGVEAFAICTDSERVFVFHDKTSTHSVTCLSYVDGSELWTADCDPSFQATQGRCWIDEINLYVSVKFLFLGAYLSYLYVLDKKEGAIKSYTHQGTFECVDADAWNIYGFDSFNDMFKALQIGGGPKQFVKVITGAQGRRPFSKVVLPLGGV